jgi:hypothetical protein
MSIYLDGRRGVFIQFLDAVYEVVPEPIALERGKKVRMGYFVEGRLEIERQCA